MLEKVKKTFFSKCRSDSEIQNLLKKFSGNTANLLDVENYSRLLGNMLSQTFLEIIKPESLPNQRLYYNIAKTILEPMLRDNYNYVNNVASKVQQSVDKKANIQIKPQKSAFPLERVNQIINAVSDQTADWETIQRRLDSPIRNITESFYDDYIAENVKFRNNAGLRCYITRSVSGNCCKWCSALAGKYAYSNAPPDIYRRHDNCHCTVTYENGKKRQDVWSKKTWQVKETSKENYKPVKLSSEQAKALEQKNLQYKGIQNNLTSAKNSDKIELKRASNNKRTDIKPITDRRFNQLTIEARKNGAIIMRGGEEVEKHLDSMNADASILGDVIFFRTEVCVSEVLEETHHFMQNINKMNDDKSEPLRTYLNEIEAKQYLLKNAEKFKIPRSETELTQKQLEYYQKLLEELNL